MRTWSPRRASTSRRPQAAGTGRFSWEAIGFLRDVEDLIAIDFDLPDFPDGLIVNSDQEVEVEGFELIGMLAGDQERFGDPRLHALRCHREGKIRSARRHPGGHRQAGRRLAWRLVAYYHRHRGELRRIRLRHRERRPRTVRAGQLHDGRSRRHLLARCGAPPPHRCAPGQPLRRGVRHPDPARSPRRRRLLVCRRDARRAADRFTATACSSSEVDPRPCRPSKRLGSRPSPMRAISQPTPPSRSTSRRSAASCATRPPTRPIASRWSKASPVARRRWTYAQLLAEAEAAARALLAALRAGRSHRGVGAQRPGVDLPRVRRGARRPGAGHGQPGVPAPRSCTTCCAVAVERPLPPAELPRQSDAGVARAGAPRAAPAARRRLVRAASPSSSPAPTPSTPLPEVSPTDPVQIQYTSGTTGLPKGALLHHRGIINNARFIAERCGMGGLGLHQPDAALPHRRLRARRPRSAAAAGDADRHGRSSIPA